MTLSLGGAWKARSADGAYETEVTVPGSLMQALERDGIFGREGLFYRENNRAAEAVARREFAFSRDFDLPSGLAGGPGRLFLEADGLDTLATITINGRELARTANMHRRYRFPIDGLVAAGRNRIEILFADAIDYIAKAQERRRLWHAYWEKPQYATPGFNRIRKSHCSFGWDWGPIVPDIGVWRDLRIVRYPAGRLGTPSVKQVHAGGKVDVEIQVEAETWDGSGAAGGLRVDFELRSPDGSLAARDSAPLGREGGAARRSAAVRLSVPEPRLWWPAGLGDQPLYRLELRLVAEGRPSGEALDERSLELGLRTLRLRREKDQWGESFALEANGLPFFARGADWIPEDVFLTRPTRERTARLLDDAAAANFNCLRVWGGGVYPSEDFFDLCDRRGLVIWQDLMFACATYDVNDPAFLAEIKAETADNLERIRHRACLGLVCGNNEMEWGFVDWGFPHTLEQRTEYLRQYQFELAAVAAAVAPEVPWWPASPSSGGDFDRPNDPDRGDTHFWEVWHHDKDFKEYEKHYFRFMSEFGFESFPCLRTVESYTLPEDRDAFSPVMEDHQRCAAGNQKILWYAAKYFRFPADFASVVYLSQVSQAEAIRHGVEHWRRNRGRCMGAVYWQFNDNWPVASWASVDYYGRWKALHYEARRCFANVLLSCRIEGAKAELHLSNEGREPVSGIVSWRLVDPEGASIREGSLPAAAGPLSSSALAELDFAAEASGAAARERILYYSFESGSAQSRGAVAFAAPKALSLRRARISIAPAGLDGAGRPLVQVSSDLPALFVELWSPSRDLVLSDNFFPLDGRSPRAIAVERDSAPGAADPSGIAASLRARSLRDSY